MEAILAIVLFIVVCAALMVWDYYKPACFQTTYSNVDKDKRSGDGGSGSFFGDGDGDGGGD